MATTITSVHPATPAERPAHLIRVAVPRLNKNDHISDYTRQRDARDYDLNWAEIEATRTLAPSEWSELMVNLLQDLGWLAGMGGTNTWDAAISAKMDAGPNEYGWLNLNEEEREQFRRTSYLLVVAVECEGEVIYIDPQGHNYARYVAFPAEGLPEGKTREELRAEEKKAAAEARKRALDARLTDPGAPLKVIDRQECATMIRAALKAGFPATKFSVRGKAYSGGHSIDVSWTDGPAWHQVRPIISRYTSRGFDGMTDTSYHCGRRVLSGALVEVSGGSVNGNRSTSPPLRRVIVNRLAAACGLAALGPVEINEYGNVPSIRVPYQWHPFWHKDEDGREKVLKLEDLEADHLLASSSDGEWFATLVNRIEGALSLEDQGEIPAALLPEYIEDERE